MNRDHLLGWPAALLVLDPEPKAAPPRIILRPYQPLTKAEQHTRAKQDQAITAQLSSPRAETRSETKPVLESKIQYFVRTFNQGRQDAYFSTPDGVLFYWARGNENWNKSKWTVKQALALHIPIKPVNTKPDWVTADV